MKPRKITGMALCAFLSISTMAVAADIKSGSQPAQKSTVTAPQDHQVKEKLQDNTFVELAASNGMAEVEISKLAVGKATNPKLKKYAASALKDQSASNIKLQQVAAQNRLDMPKKLDERYLRMINELKGLSGAEFDKAYINLMKKSQDMTVALYDNAAGEPTLNVELRVFANQTLPALRARQESTHALIDSSDQLSQR